MNNSNDNNNNNNIFGFPSFLYQSNDIYFPIDWFSVTEKPTPVINDAEPLIIGDLFDDDCEVNVVVPGKEEKNSDNNAPVTAVAAEAVVAQQPQETEATPQKETEDDDEDEDYWECPEDDWEEDDVYDDMDEEFEEGSRWERRLYNPKNHSGLIERSKQENKKEKITKRFVCAARYNAEMYRRECARQQYAAANENARRERELNAALEASRRAVALPQVYKRNPNPPARCVKTNNNNNNGAHAYNQHHHPAGAVVDRRNLAADIQLTLAQIQELQNRELTPEDYELLLLLDASLPKKTISKSLIDDWETITLKEDSEDLCCICMCNYLKGDKLKLLPCSHRFHLDCIETWLTTASVNCPIDGLPLKKE